MRGTVPKYSALNPSASAIDAADFKKPGDARPVVPGTLQQSGERASVNDRNWSSKRSQRTESRNRQIIFLRCISRYVELSPDCYCTTVVMFYHEVNLFSFCGRGGGGGGVTCNAPRERDEQTSWQHYYDVFHMHSEEAYVEGGGGEGYLPYDRSSTAMIAVLEGEVATHVV